MKVIAIANQKGGVGKTTTAVNLGCALAHRGQRILLIDLDPQGNATSSFGLQELEGESLYDPLVGNGSAIEKVLPTRHGGMFIIPADLDLAGAEIEIARMDNHLTRLSDTIEPFRADNTFDFRAARLPALVRHFDDERPRGSDELLTPIQCEFFALEGLW
jgi:chromosome partitioning protein